MSWQRKSHLQIEKKKLFPNYKNKIFTLTLFFPSGGHYQKQSKDESKISWDLTVKCILVPHCHDGTIF